MKQIRSATRPNEEVQPRKATEFNLTNKNY